MAAAAAVLAAVIPAAGCGKDERPLPAACTRGSHAIAAALKHAPGPVRLAGGTRLSTCIERARSDADLQTVGAVYTQVADSLATEAPRDDRAALQLGYLVGAVRRGASKTAGIHYELERRVEQELNGVDAGSPEFTRGERAGEASG